jgi:formamidopyrimidine-DNA glycosylase
LQDVPRACVQGHGAAKYVRIKDSDEWPPKYTKLHLKFEDGTQLAFADARRFARIKLQEAPLECEPLCKLGPDAFEELPAFDEFAALMGRQRRALKAVFLDQAVLSGIGNWVADEVCCTVAVACGGNLCPRIACVRPERHGAVVWMFHYPGAD